MRNRFYSNLQKIAPDCEKAGFLLAVSGGKDSTVLAHLFAECGLQFDIAHCNFHLRGEASNEDMRFVQNLAKNLHKELFIKEFETLSIQKNSGDSIEMTARKLRYDWFHELSAHYDYVVTAHHADDNAETLILNLARGTGLNGLCGIPEKNGKIIRPLLPFSSDEILHYAQAHLMPFRVDQSNLSEQFQRNKIRLSILPKLKEINPDLIATFSQNIHIFNQLKNFFFHQICQISAEITHFENKQFYIDIDKLSAIPEPELVLFELLRPYHFEGRSVNSIIDNLHNEPGRIFFSSTHQLLKDRRFLIVREKNSTDFVPHFCNSASELRALGFSVEYKKIADEDGCSVEKLWEEIHSANADTLFADADKMTFPVEIRKWEAGDWFIPLGMKGKKKLSDFFINQKIDCYAKEQVRLLISKGQVVWVIGWRTDQRFCIDENTKHYYKIEYNGRI